jgi:hypothetical protein
MDAGCCNGTEIYALVALGPGCRRRSILRDFSEPLPRYLSGAPKEMSDPMS